ncbi:hypothetical protein LIER_09183 [Lithospermum erythrorhizon]|uniref:Gag-pol polyprotein n=1 Tax=Lithospermum erythrorhizon TaxID=34254 RepID=A0AAV3PEW9_LITER
MEANLTNNNVTIVKVEAICTGEEEELALGNNKTLNAIFNVVDVNLFKLINTCTVAKKAWETLETSYEGN